MFCYLACFFETEAVLKAWGSLHCVIYMDSKQQFFITNSFEFIKNPYPLRDALRMEVDVLVPDFAWHSDSLTLLLRLLHDSQLPVPVAKYVYDVLAVFYSVPMYVPAPYLYSPLLHSQA